MCDETLWTGVPGVYAAGDVASWSNPMFGVRHATWRTGPPPLSRAAPPPGTRSIRQTPNRYETVPYFWSDWYGSRIQFVGVPDSEEVLLVDGDVDTRRPVDGAVPAGRSSRRRADGQPSDRDHEVPQNDWAKVLLV